MVVIRRVVRVVLGGVRPYRIGSGLSCGCRTCRTVQVMRAHPSPLAGRVVQIEVEADAGHFALRRRDVGGGVGDGRSRCSHGRRRR